MLPRTTQKEIEHLKNRTIEVGAGAMGVLAAVAIKGAFEAGEVVSKASKGVRSALSLQARQNSFEEIIEPSRQADTIV
jgi:hypothetical protein